MHSAGTIDVEQDCCGRELLRIEPLAEFLGQTKGSVSQTDKGLEAKGLLKRLAMPSTGDRSISG